MFFPTSHFTDGSLSWHHSKWRKSTVVMESRAIIYYECSVAHPAKPFLLVREKLRNEIFHRDNRLLLMDHTGSTQAVDSLLSPLQTEERYVRWWEHFSTSSTRKRKTELWCWVKSFQKRNHRWEALPVQHTLCTNRINRQSLAEWLSIFSLWWRKIWDIG